MTQRKSSLSQVLTLVKSRISAIFIWSWCTFVSCMVVSHGSPPLTQTISAIAATALIVTSVYLYNDLCDSEMDKLNKLKADRPLVQGTVDETVVKAVVAVAGVSGLAVAWTINLSTFLIAFLWFALFMAYSHPVIRLKRRFLLKELVTSAGWPLGSLIGSYAISGAASLPAVFSAVAFGSFGFLILPALSETFDEYEDSIYQVKSLSRALSWRRRVQLLGVAVLLMMTLTPLTYRQFGFNVIFPASVVMLSLVLLRFGVYPIWGGFEVGTVMRARKMAYAYYMVTQILMIVGSLSLNVSLPFFG